MSGINKDKTDVFQWDNDWTQWLANESIVDAVTYEVTNGAVLTSKTFDDETSTVTVSFDSVGRFTLCAKATDQRGNVASKSVTYNVTDC